MVMSPSKKNININVNFVCLITNISFLNICIGLRKCDFACFGVFKGQN